MMHKFTHAAVLAVAISAPVLAGALMDHSVASAAPGTGGGCSSSCSVGGAAYPSPGQGGHTTGTGCCGTPLTESGTLAVTGFPSGSGRVAVGGTLPGTASGNFTGGIPTSKGHCTGQFIAGGVCG
jgi:hypothetical protein